MFSKALLGLSLAGIVVLAILLFKAGLNYAGVCTVGINVTKWHRVTSGELLDYLTLKGGSKAGVKTIYSIPELWSVPGDHYSHASFLDKLMGRSATLIHFYNPWMDDGRNLHPDGYFYAPNCLNLPRH
ncbi:hypothetical protein G6L29_29055 [Agrobacterium rhizogenes]|uniref:hypothetical protein n=1 Tax=Rhizobium rhizogenes TaxID=359 RepID=UPI001573196D|nr:hypothetical protein [Rhizobium rhizogenes]NTI19722.1 hypothetical protein [Rhizobium rhizogenes]